MVKFFLRDEKTLPKSQLAKNKDKKIKKVTDYRIVIWKKLFNLLKKQHTIMIQKIIRKIKDKKRKLSKLDHQHKQNGLQHISEQEQQNSHENDSSKNKNVVSDKISKQVQKLQTKYNQLKLIKKEQLRKVTLYIIMQILKIQNCDKIFEKYQMKKQDILGQAAFQYQQSNKKNKIKEQNKEDEEQVQEDEIKQKKIPTKLKEQVQNDSKLKNFFSKLAMLTDYMTQLENCAKLLDVVQQKKLLKKGKLKERKQRKYQKGKLQKDNQNVQKKQSKQNQSQKQQNENQNTKKSFDKPIKQYKKQSYKNQSQNNQKKYDRNNNFNKSHSKEQRFNNKSHQNNHKFNKPIHKPYNEERKQRTQFKKTGRNKVKYQKQQKKYKFKDQNKNQQQGETNKKQFKPFLAYKKQYAHPSWQAKQQLKQQVFIKKFQGKKIML